jgi:probable phosphoglycerate mutase
MLTSESPLPSLVLLVRHGATEWSQTGQHTGRTDLELNAEGRAQAKAIGPTIERLLEGFAPLVFTSPLKRAAETARLALPGATATVVDDLMEYDYGQYEGLTTSQILERDPKFDLFGRGCPGGETPDAVSARCDAFSDLLHKTASRRAVVAFTHGHLSRILTARMLGLPISTAAALFNETASVSMINVHRGRWVLVGWNIHTR